MSSTLPILVSHAQGLPSTSVGVTNSYANSLSSTDILRGHKTVEINHNGATYRLRATRLGKLILTK